jgi:exodeoxyribonuclease-1
VVPSPDALLTHGIPITAMVEGDREVDAVQRIHRLLNEPGTISLGYNTLGFDDEMLRFSFYRNLLAPYTHQYNNGCRRMDLLPMVILYRLYRPEILQWPDIQGKPSLKLEHLNAANTLSEGTSHHALNDACASVELARRLATRRRMWEYLSGFFHKPSDIRRMEKLPPAVSSSYGAHRQALMIATEFGPNLLYQSPVLSLGPSIPYANQTLWLRLDLPELQAAHSENIAETTWVLRKKAGESGLLLPPLERYWNRLDPQRREIVGDNLNWIRANTDALEAIVHFHRNYRYPEIPDLDLDAALYMQEFPSRDEEVLCRRFLQASVADRFRLVERFPRQAYRELAERLLFRNYPDQIPEPWKKRFSAFLLATNPATEAQATVDFRGNRKATPRRVAGRIRELLTEPGLQAEHRKRLHELSDYLEKTFHIRSHNGNGTHGGDFGHSAPGSDPG